MLKAQTGAYYKALALITIMQVICLFFSPTLFAQTSLSCPPNIDFETGTLNNWNCYTGGCCPINTPLLSGPVTGRHTVVSTGTDPYGNFPVNPAGNGAYSLKLGNSSTGAQAEKVRYYIHVPSGVNDYSLIYRYAVVFQDPNHTLSQQPRFEITAYDSATNNSLPCALRTYVASSSLPGFTLSNIGSNVYYLPWTTGTLDLSGMAGQTVVVDFASGDCSLGGHFGYGYIDMSCGLFQISTAGCDVGGTTTLSAPLGYQTYTWLDSAMTTVLGTGQTVNITTPAVTTKYKVVLVPYLGFGCPDTLETQITISDLDVVLTPDTALCNAGAVQLNAAITGGLGTITYNWTPTSTLSCTNCTNPIATPTSSTDYIFSVTDSTGCIKKDTATLLINEISVSTQHVSCYGFGDATATANIITGAAPYAYSWNTTPTQSTASLNNLVPGTYTVTVTDNDGCVKTDSAVITQPDSLTAAAATIDISCYGANNGQITITPNGGTSPYTYSLNATTYVSNPVFNALNPTTHTITVKDNHGCLKAVSAVILEPDSLSMSFTITDINCYSFNTGQIIANVSGGNPPYQYAINSSSFTSNNTFNTLTAGTYNITVQDANNCSKTMTATVSEPPNLVIGANLTDILCNGDSTGLIVASGTGGITPYTFAIDLSAYSPTATFGNLPAGTYVVKINDSNSCYKDTTVTLTEPTLIVPTVVTTMPLCYGDSTGIIDVAATGGIPTYIYAVDNSQYTTGAHFPNMPAGSHVVYVRDQNSCVRDTTITVGTPPLLTFTTDLITNKCFDDTTAKIIFTANGGTPPYQYRYSAVGSYQSSPIINSIHAGSYYVYVQDQNGCTKVDSVTITQPSPVTLDVWKQNPTCEGYEDGVVYLTGVGGYTPYTYSRDGGATYSSVAGFSDIGEGTYTYYILDSNSCAHDTTITFTGYPYIRFYPEVTQPSCYGYKNGMIDLNGTGGVQPLSYQLKKGSMSWQSSSVFDSLKVGNYSFQIKDSKGCAKDTTLSVYQPDKLDISMIMTPNDCIGSNTEGGVKAEVTGGIYPYNYLWDTNPVSTGESISGYDNGRYTVIVKDDHNCVDSATAIIAYDNCCTPAIPDAFTPNGDGKNDVFKLIYKGDIVLQEFSIFNRYGQRMFATTNVYEGWNGTFNSTPQEMGTYFFYTRFICGNGGNNVVELKGDVVLIR